MEKLLFPFIIIFFETIKGMIKTPTLIKEGDFPFLLSTPKDGYNYILISGHSFRIKIESGEIDEFGFEKFLYPSNSIFIFDKSYHNYIYNNENNNS